MGWLIAPKPGGEGGDVDGGIGNDGSKGEVEEKPRDDRYCSSEEKLDGSRGRPAASINTVRREKYSRYTMAKVSRNLAGYQTDTYLSTFPRSRATEDKEMQIH